MSNKQEQTVVRPETINMQMHENDDGWESLGPENWEDNYDPEQDRPLYESPSDEITNLKQRLLDSQKQVELFQRKWIAAINRGSNIQSDLGLLKWTHNNYIQATNEQTNDLKNKLKESESKVKDLQKRFSGKRNLEDQTDARNQQQELKKLQMDFKNLKTNSEKRIENLKTQLQYSENKGKELHEKWEAASDKAEQHKFQLDQLQKEFKTNQTNSDKTICGLKKQLQMVQKQLQKNKENTEKTIDDLKKQLAEARDNKPENNSDTVPVVPINAKLGEVNKNLPEQSSQPAAELCAEPSSQATDLKSAKEADLEVKSSKQQEQIQQQLQEAQRELEEQATQRRQERQQFQSEMEELQFQLATYKDLHASYLKIMKEEKEEKSCMATQLEKAKAEKELLQETVERLQESAQEKHGTEKGKEEKGDSLLDSVKSLQESLKTKQEKEKILNAKLDELEAHPTMEAEKPKKKKKKRNWFLRLFTRNAS